MDATGGLRRTRDLVGTSPSQFTSLESADVSRPTAGATGAVSATATASSGNVAQAIALRPSAGGPPPVNNEPTFDQNVPDQSHAEGAVVTLDAGATDLDNDPLTYAATNLPAGLSINTSTGLITGTIAFTAAAGSPYSVSVTVRDGATVDATDTFTWTVTNVNREPTFDQDVPNQNHAEGAVISLDAGATDLDGDPLTYAATNLPPGLSISPTTGLITGTIGATGADTSPYSVSVTVRDGATVDATDTFTWTVTEVPPPNQPPTFDQDVPSQSNAEGAVISLDAGATDPESDPLTYAATGLPAGLSIDTGTGLITGTIAFTAAAGSPYNVSVTVRDGPTVDATDTFQWTVTNVNREPTFDQDVQNRTDPEGAVISLDAGATDLDSDPLTYAATNLPTGLTINTATGLITGTISSTAAAGSPYSVSVTVRDGATVDATDIFTWTVTDVPAGSAIALRAVSSGSNNASTTSIVLNRPIGTLAGDVMLASLDVRGTSTVTAPAGWTLIRTDTYTSSLRMHVYWRLATGSDPATWTWTLLGLASGGRRDPRVQRGQHDDADRRIGRSDRGLTVGDVDGAVDHHHRREHDARGVLRQPRQHDLDAARGLRRTSRPDRHVAVAVHVDDVGRCAPAGRRRDRYGRGIGDDVVRQRGPAHRPPTGSRWTAARQQRADVRPEPAQPDGSGGHGREPRRGSDRPRR